MNLPIRYRYIIRRAGRKILQKGAPAVQTDAPGIQFFIIFMMRLPTKTASTMQMMVSGTR